MISEKIKELRTAHGLTQKDLADKLFVTAQAVSRWENGLVEPSLSTIVEMAKIFNVSVDEILEVEIVKPVVEKKETSEVSSEAKKPETGYSKIYSKVNTDDSSNDDGFVPYKITDQKVATVKPTEKKKDINVSNLAKKEELLENRKKSFIWGAVTFVGVLVFSIILVFTTDITNIMPYGAIIAVLGFLLTASICLDNNYLIDIVGGIMNFGFIKLPGLIFALSIDGIIWFITIKLTLCVISMILSAFAFLLSLAVGGFCAIFVYPYAIIRNINEVKKLS